MDVTHPHLIRANYLSQYDQFPNSPHPLEDNAGYIETMSPLPTTRMPDVSQMIAYMSFLGVESVFAS